MAIYHLNTKHISRKSGRSATAAAAYRSGSKIVDNRTGEIYDYSKKSGVLHAEIVTPDDSLIDRSELWNLAEKTEKRKDARTAREIVVALPHELTLEQQKIAVKVLVKQLTLKYGVAVDCCIHAPSKDGDDRNYHAHLLITTRKFEIGADGQARLTDKSDLELSDTDLKKQNKDSGAEQIKDIREMWERDLNTILEYVGFKERVSSKSNEARGITAEPTIKMGVAATAMERKGIKTERGDINRAIKSDNQRIDRQDPILVDEPLNTKNLTLEQALVISKWFEQDVLKNGLGSAFELATSIDKNLFYKARQMAFKHEEQQQEQFLRGFER